jgi:hypothetical protein
MKSLFIHYCTECRQEQTPSHKKFLYYYITLCNNTNNKEDKMVSVYSIFFISEGFTTSATNA